jgi:multidrug transporter EmrE-like cation transporter
MKDLYVGTSIITLTAIIEAFALYFVRGGNTIAGSLIYGLIVIPLLGWSIKYEGIGLMNFMWNILSTMFGFAIGVYLYGEKVRSVQIMGVLVSLTGVAMILLDPEAK